MNAFGAQWGSVLVVGILLPIRVASAGAQDIQPRFLRYAPVGSMGVGLAYNYSFGAVLPNKTIPVEDVRARIHSVAGAYSVYFDVFGITGRASVGGALTSGKWEGDVGDAGDVGAVVTRTGLSDPVVSAALLIVGGPSRSASEFRTHTETTFVGVNVRVRVPLGQYDQNQVINIGSNRWSVSPRLGVSHAFGRHWNVDGYASAWFFTDNRAFVGGSTFSQALLMTLQANVEYEFDNGVWLAASTRQSFGGETSINGVGRDNPQLNNRVGLTVNVPISRHNQLRVALTTGLSTSFGNDYTSFYATWAHGWML